MLDESFLEFSYEEIPAPLTQKAYNELNHMNNVAGISLTQEAYNELNCMDNVAGISS